MKRCPRCKQEKSLDEYYKDKHRLDGVTSVCMPCKRAYSREYLSTERGRKMVTAKRMRYYRKDPTKEKVRSLLKYAVNMGRIVKPTTCERCGYEDKIEGHHIDYTKPYDVMWLCKLCHMAVEHKLVDKKLDRKEAL